MGSPPAGAPNTGGLGNMGDFQPVFRYVSETVQDRNMLLVVCDLPNGTISNYYLVTLNAESTQNLVSYGLQGIPC